MNKIKKFKQNVKCKNCSYIKNSNFSCCCRPCHDGKNYHDYGCNKKIFVDKNVINKNYMNKCKNCSYTKNPNFSCCCEPCYYGKGFHDDRCSKILSTTYITTTNAFESDTIYFYHKNQPYYEFTNFFHAPMTINGIMYSTSEHYFQAHKFWDTNAAVAKLIIAAKTPKEAFDIAQQYKSFVPSDWHNGLKDKIMFFAITQKFIQNPNLKKLLLSTGNKQLVERSPFDNYWGDGGNGTGKNQLGKLLMILRNYFLQNSL